MGKPSIAGQYRPAEHKSYQMHKMLLAARVIKKGITIDIGIRQLEPSSVGWYTNDHVSCAHAEGLVQLDGVLEVVEVAGVTFLVLRGAILQGGVVTSEPKNRWEYIRISNFVL